MSDRKEKLTFADVVKSVAQEFDRTVTDADIDYILWEHTGFPAFFDGDPEECVRRQVKEYFESQVSE